MFLDAYILLSILIALMDLYLGVLSIRKNRTTGRYLGLACIGAAIVDLSYLISILSSSYFLHVSDVQHLFYKHRFYVVESCGFYRVFYKRKLCELGEKSNASGGILCRF